MSKQTVTEFFNPYNIEHLRAYRHLEKTGFWPEGFLPDDLVIDEHWQIELVAKMARAWLEHNVVFSQ